MSPFIQESYERHREEFNKFDPEFIKKYDSWFDTGTVDYWRHMRMIRPVEALLKSDPESSWITLGDGRFGLDSMKLRHLAPKISVLPTDISPYLLEQAKEKGLIDQFSVENAEQLSFEDDGFDYAFCKESYHHFPRPYAAVYEMLRVARKAVIFIEPLDHTFMPLPLRIVSGLKRRVKAMLGREIPHPDATKFETSGNYIYSISVRELQKTALGMHLPAIAYTFYNDYYESGVEYEPASESSAVFRRVRGEIEKQDKRCKRGMQVYGGIVGVIFKTAPDQQTRSALQQYGFTVEDLPKNPYM